MVRDICLYAIRGLSKDLLVSTLLGIHTLNHVIPLLYTANTKYRQVVTKQSYYTRPTQWNTINPQTQHVQPPSFLWHPHHIRFSVHQTPEQSPQANAPWSQERKTR